MSNDQDVAANLRRTLRLRPAVQQDYDVLREMRRECGWGEERLIKQWMTPSRPTVVIVGQLSDGSEVDVGMGGLAVDEGDGLSSKEEGTVQIFGLYVRKQFQKMGLGSLAITLIEQHAVEQYQARTITLDTTAYQLSEAKDGTHLVEDFAKRNPVCEMYARRGYEYWGIPEATHPNRTGPPLHIIKMRKAVSVVPRAESS